MTDVLKDRRRDGRRNPMVRALGAATEWKTSLIWNRAGGELMPEMWGGLPFVPGCGEIGIPPELQGCFYSADRIRISVKLHDSNDGHPAVFPIRVRLRIRTRDLLASQEVFAAEFALSAAQAQGRAIFLAEVRGFETVDKFEVLFEPVSQEAVSATLIGVVDRCCLEPAYQVGPGFDQFVGGIPEVIVFVPSQTVHQGNPGSSESAWFTRTGTPTSSNDQANVVQLAPAVVGQNVIVAAQAGTTVRVYRLVLSVDAPTTLRLLSSGGQVLVGPIYLGANGAWVLDTSGNPWAVSNTGEGLDLDSSAAVNIGGAIYTTQS